jgi:hypothetical protein
MWVHGGISLRTDIHFKACFWISSKDACTPWIHLKVRLRHRHLTWTNNASQMQSGQIDPWQNCSRLDIDMTGKTHSSWWLLDGLLKLKWFFMFPASLFKSSISGLIRSHHLRSMYIQVKVTSITLSNPDPETTLNLSPFCNRDSRVCPFTKFDA